MASKQGKGVGEKNKIVLGEYDEMIRVRDLTEKGLGMLDDDTRVRYYNPLYELLIVDRGLFYDLKYNDGFKDGQVFKYAESTARKKLSLDDWEVE